MQRGSDRLGGVHGRGSRHWPPAAVLTGLAVLVGLIGLLWPRRDAVRSFLRSCYVALVKPAARPEHGSVKIELDGDPIELGASSLQTQQELFEEWVKRQAAENAARNAESESYRALSPPPTREAADAQRRAADNAIRQVEAARRAEQQAQSSRRRYERQVEVRESADVIRRRLELERKLEELRRRAQEEASRRMTSSSIRNYPPHLNSLIANLNSQTTEGQFLFNPPHKMRQGQKERVEVGIARTTDLVDELFRGLKGRGDPVVEDIKTSTLMQVDLRGDGFEVASLSTPEQVVAPTASWAFDVTPLRAGHNTLTVTATMRLDLPNQKEGKVSVPAIERSVRVEVDIAYQARRFASNNWQWLAATILGLAGTVTAWLALFK